MVAAFAEGSAGRHGQTPARRRGHSRCRGRSTTEPMSCYSWRVTSVACRARSCRVTRYRVRQCHTPCSKGSPARRPRADRRPRCDIRFSVFCEQPVKLRSVFNNEHAHGDRPFCVAPVNVMPVPPSARRRAQTTAVPAAAYRRLESPSARTPRRTHGKPPRRDWRDRKRPPADRSSAPR